MVTRRLIAWQSKKKAVDYSALMNEKPKAKYKPPPQAAEIDPDATLVDEEMDMAAVMGFGGFGKQKSVEAKVSPPPPPPVHTYAAARASSRARSAMPPPAKKHPKKQLLLRSIRQSPELRRPLNRRLSTPQKRAEVQQKLLDMTRRYPHVHLAVVILSNLYLPSAEERGLPLLTTGVILLTTSCAFTHQAHAGCRGTRRGCGGRAGGGGGGGGGGR